MKPRLMLVPPDQTPQQSARNAIVAISQEYNLRLFDALVDLAAVHSDPLDAVEELHALRGNALGVTAFVFDDVIHRETRRAVGL